MLESEAWCSLSRGAFRVVCRVILEHLAHGGTFNGNLPVTYADFVKYGCRRESLKEDIAEAAACGLIVVTQKGRASIGPDRWPSKYALGWLPRFDGAPPANRWKAWRKPPEPQAVAPIARNIESSTGCAPRENGANPRALWAKTPLAPAGENAPREIRKSAIPCGRKRC
jgi:hypothetical protein